MPTKNRHKRDNNLLARLVLAVAVVEPLMTLPQIYQIWAHKQAAGISILTWSCYVAAALIWLFYGVKIKDKPLVIASALWVITEGLVVLGAIRY